MLTDSKILRQKAIREINQREGLQRIITGERMGDQHIEPMPDWVAIPSIECALYEALIREKMHRISLEEHVEKLTKRILELENE